MVGDGRIELPMNRTALRRAALPIIAGTPRDEWKRVASGKYRLVLYRGYYGFECYRKGKRSRISLRTKDRAEAESLLAHIMAGYQGRTAIKRPNFVYIVQNGCDRGFIKIGMASNPKKRIDAIQSGSPYPIEVLAILEGGRALERKLHERFSHLHERGEWFRPSEELWGYIDEVSKSCQTTSKEAA